MNTLKASLLAAAVAGSTLIATAADARGGHYHGGGHRHHHGSHVGIWFGAPLFAAPYYYYPRYYYPAAPAVVAAPPVYIEQSAPSAPPAPAVSGARAYWYYCRDSQTYYPYVQQCASPWQQVVPNGAPPS